MVDRKLGFLRCINGYIIGAENIGILYDSEFITCCVRHEQIQGVDFSIRNSLNVIFQRKSKLDIFSFIQNVWRLILTGNRSLRLIDAVNGLLCTDKRDRSGIFSCTLISVQDLRYQALFVLKMYPLISRISVFIHDRISFFIYDRLPVLNILEFSTGKQLQSIIGISLLKGNLTPEQVIDRGNDKAIHLRYFKSRSYYGDCLTLFCCLSNGYFCQFRSILENGIKFKLGRRRSDNLF